MKILVTYSKVFDSEEFYEGVGPEELSDLTSSRFLDGISDYLEDEPIRLSDCKIVILEADESNL